MCIQGIVGWRENSLLLSFKAIYSSLAVYSSHIISSLIHYNNIPLGSNHIPQTHRPCVRPIPPDPKIGRILTKDSQYLPS